MAVNERDPILRAIEVLTTRLGDDGSGGTLPDVRVNGEDLIAVTRGLMDVAILLLMSLERCTGESPTDWLQSLAVQVSAREGE